MWDLIQKYNFSLLHLLSSFTLPIIIVLLGLKSNFSLIADISILQSIIFMIFFPFSGYSRNYILNSSENDLIQSILNFRSLLYLPLILFSLLISYYIVSLDFKMLLLMVIVGSSFWFIEIFLTEAEKQKSSCITITLILFNLIGLIYLFSSEINLNSIRNYLFFLFIIYAPFISYTFLKNIFNVNFKNLKTTFKNKILRQIGGTTVVGLSSFILKFFLLLILPKTIAGTIFLGYTIGAALCTTITYSFIPSVIFNNYIKLKRAFITFCIIFCMAGILVIIIKYFKMTILNKNQDLFLICSLFSLGGSLISIFSQYYKLYVSHIITDLNVFLYELLINLITIILVILAVLFLNEYGSVFTYILSGICSLYVYKNLFKKLKELDQ